MVFVPFDKVIRKGSEPWTEASISKPKPTLLDFESDFVKVPNRLLNDVKTLLENVGFSLVIGEQNSGKTWLSYAIGYDLCILNRKRVWYAVVDEEFNANEAWREIAHYKQSKLKSVYFIIENCHENPDEAEKFLQKICDEKIANAKFLLTTRKIGTFVLRDEEILDFFYDKFVNKLKCDVRLSFLDKKEITEGIIQEFIEIKKIKYELKNEELASVVNAWAADLYQTYFHLRAWDPSKGQRLSVVGAQETYDFLWEGQGGICLKKEFQRQILSRLAVICQFEPLKVPDKFLHQVSIDEDELCSLKNNEIVQTYPNNFCGVTESLSRLILSAIENNLSDFNREHTTKQLLKEYLEELLHLRRSKKESQSPKWRIIFQALSLAGHEVEIARETLLCLISDAQLWTEIKRNAKFLSTEAAGTLISNILPLARDKAEELRAFYSFHHSQEVDARLKLSSATSIYGALASLSRIFNLNLLFINFSVSDFESIIRRSTISGLRHLFFNFEKYKLTSSISTKLGEAMASIPKEDLAELIAKHDSLYSLGGFIGNIKNISVSIAKNFIENLSHIDLSNLFLKEDVLAAADGYSKIASINFFFSRHLLLKTQNGNLAPAQNAKLFVNNIADELWLRFIHISSPIEGIWLLWNIFRYSKEKAKSLVLKNAAAILLKKNDVCLRRTLFTRMSSKKKLIQDRLDFHLPLLGLLLECDFDISKIPLPEEDTQIIRDRLKRFENWRGRGVPQPTLFILSLRALRNKLPEKDYNENVKDFILNREPMRSYVYFHKDLQVRKILINLIESYAL
ncbi:hypothetical protein E2P60_06565 [Candidatus Bathyarchaeota archaeon]|nr:hypothetical protein E2P60_06565 [Candidatus Bathyarchaeota archaeon]